MADRVDEKLCNDRHARIEAALARIEAHMEMTNERLTAIETRATVWGGIWKGLYVVVAAAIGGVIAWIGQKFA
jgi:hypothetical protein